MKTNRVVILVMCLLVSGLLVTACSEKKSDAQSAAAPGATPPPITAANAAQTTLLRTLKGHGVGVASLAFSPDGTVLASGGVLGDPTVRLWNAQTGESLRVIDAAEHVIHQMAFSPDGKTIAAASGDGTLRLWEVSTGNLLAEVDKVDGQIKSVVFAPDGKTLFSTAGLVVKRWDAATYELLDTLEGNEKNVSSLAINPDGSLLAAGSVDGSVRLWDLASSESPTLLGDHAAPVFVLDFSPDGNLLASLTLTNEVMLWDIQAGSAQVIRSVDDTSPGISDLAFNSDGSVLAFSSPDSTIELWDVAAGVSLATLQAHDKWVSGLAFNPDGTLLASGSADATIGVWGIDGDAAPGVSSSTGTTPLPAESSVVLAAHSRSANRWMQPAEDADPNTILVRSFPPGLETRVIPKAAYEGWNGNMYTVTDDYLVGVTPVETEVEPGDYYVQLNLPFDQSAEFWPDGEVATVYYLSDNGEMVPGGKTYRVTKRGAYQAIVSSLFWFKETSLEEFVTSLPEEQLFSVPSKAIFEAEFEQYGIPEEDWPHLLLMFERMGKLVWHSPELSKPLIIAVSEPAVIEVITNQDDEPDPTRTPASPDVLPTADVQPASELTPTPASGCVVDNIMVIAGTGPSGLNVRENPGFGAVPVFLAQEGERVQILGGPQTMDGQKWCQIRREQDGLTGWALLAYLSEAATP